MTDLWSFTWTEDEEPNLRSAVFQAIGGASACWDNLEGAGVFDSTRAQQIAETLLAFIKGRRAR